MTGRVDGIDPGKPGYEESVRRERLTRLLQGGALWRPASAAPADTPPAQRSGRPVLPAALAYLASRVEHGTAQYGGPLTTHNGRHALLDALEEAADLYLYLLQACLEEGLVG